MTTPITAGTFTQLQAMLDDCARMVDQLPSRAEFDALVGLARQYRLDMQFPELDAGQRARRIEAIDAVLAKAAERRP